jgi:hypothetical protein
VVEWWVNKHFKNHLCPHGQQKWTPWMHKVKNSSSPCPSHFPDIIKMSATISTKNSEHSSHKLCIVAIKLGQADRYILLCVTKQAWLQACMATTLRYTGGTLTIILWITDTEMQDAAKKPAHRMIYQMYPIRTNVLWRILVTHTTRNEWQNGTQNSPEGLDVSGRPAPGTKVFDFFAISFCSSLPFLLLKRAFASSLSCHMKHNSVTHYSSLLIYINPCSTAAHFRHHPLPYSSSSYNITKQHTNVQCSIL